jgi:hypothetical protein
MALMIDEVLLLGEVARDPEVSFSDNGAQIARAECCLERHRQR